MPLEESPVGEHSSNGDIQSAVKRVQCQFRTMKTALEARIGEKLTGNLDVIPWLVTYSADVIRRYQLGIDGKISHQRMRGRRFRKSVPKWGKR